MEKTKIEQETDALSFKKPNKDFSKRSNKYKFELIVNKEQDFKPVVIYVDFKNKKVLKREEG